MNKINIGDRVISKGYPNLGEEVGVVVGIDPGEDPRAGKYFVKFDSLDLCSGWVFGIFRDDPHLIVKPYEGFAVWVHEDDLVKVEEECKEDKHEENEHEEDEYEENIRMEFERVREQKKEIVKDMSEKVLKLTLEIKKIEAEIEKIKKEWCLN